MKILKLFALPVVCLWLGSPAQAAPKVISSMAGAATTYSFFQVDTNKLKGQTVAGVQAALQLQLDSVGLTACWVTGDLNATNINCGNGAMRFGNTEFYTYNLETRIAGFPLDKDMKVVIREAQGVNFISPNGLTVPGDTTGRVVRIHFNQRVARFGMLVDAGAATAPSVNGIQFIVNRQSTQVQPLTAGAPQFVGVEDSAGFTDVTIIASGTPRAWIADQFAFVPLAAF
jgi:hypothetical protein